MINIPLYSPRLFMLPPLQLASHLMTISPTISIVYTISRLTLKFSDISLLYHYYSLHSFVSNKVKRELFFNSTSSWLQFHDIRWLKFYADDVLCMMIWWKQGLKNFMSDLNLNRLCEYELPRHSVHEYLIVIFCVIAQATHLVVL